MATALVIPAKAGIQRLVNGKKALDPSFRWDDDQAALNLLEKTFSVCLSIKHFFKSFVFPGQQRAKAGMTVREHEIGAGLRGPAK
jgi:hypothetical protein